MKAVKKLIVGGLALSLMASVNVFGQVAYGKTLGEVTQKAVYRNVEGQILEQAYQGNPVVIEFGEKEVQFNAENESHMHMLQAYIQKNFDVQFSFEKYTMEVSLDPYEKGSAIIFFSLKCGDFIVEDVGYDCYITKGYLDQIVKFGYADYDLSVEWTGENIADEVLMKKEADSCADFCKGYKGYYYVGKQEVKRLVNFGNGHVFYRVSTDLDNKDGGGRGVDTEYDADAIIIDNFKSNKEAAAQKEKAEKAFILNLKDILAVMHKHIG
ncbi:MAG: hypothetical protein AB7E42_08780 [Anaerotignaceae bacterium]